MVEVFELLEKTGLNWSVKKEALETADGKPTESFGLFRNDTNKWLGTVGNRYKVYDNSKLATVIIKASEGLVQPESIKGGYLSGGGKIYLQIPLEDRHIHTDTIKRNITALNSHDGSTSISFGSSNTIVVCQNTFYKAHRELKKFRHTESAENQIKSAAEQLKKAILKDDYIMNSFEKMAETPLDMPIFSTLINKIFEVDMDVKGKDVSTRKKNILKKFNDAIESELTSHGESLWGLFNAVTFYTNHIESEGKTNSEISESLMFGSGYTKNLIAYDEIFNHMESKKKSLIVL